MKSKKLKISVFANVPYLPFEMYRLIMPMSYLQTRGHDIEILNIPMDKQFTVTYHGEICIFHRNMLVGDSVVFNHCLEHGKKVVIDLDDWLYYPKTHPAFKQNVGSKRVADNLIEKLKRCHLITVSTPMLQKFVSELIPNVPVEVCYNTLPLEFMPKVERKKSDKIRFGYLGGQLHEADLREIRNVVSDLYKKVGDKFEMYLTNPQSYKYHFTAKFKMNIYKEILCNGKDLPITFHSLPLTPFYEFFPLYNQFDVALAPVAKSDFAHCKSSIKFMEAAYMGLPLIGSCVEPYTSMIEYGQNGFTCSTRSEWVEAMVYLINNPKRIKELASKAKKTCKGIFDFVKNQKIREQIYLKYF